MKSLMIVVPIKNGLTEDQYQEIATVISNTIGKHGLNVDAPFPVYVFENDHDQNIDFSRTHNHPNAHIMNYINRSNN